MKLSARTRYASRLLLDLAINAEDAPLNAATLSEHTGISIKFIEQIFKPLKASGLVQSKRGATGGHTLAKMPGDITLGEIVRVMEGGISLVLCGDDTTECDRAEDCRTRATWVNVSRALEDALDAITLTTLLQEPQDACQNLLEDNKKPLTKLT